MLPICIDETVLSDFLAGRISADQASEVESHLAICSKCQSQAARHSSQFDSLLAVARSSVASDPLEREPELAVALSAIGRLYLPGSAGFDLTQTAAPEIHNYRLIEKLGEGGMGTVYRAVHVHLEKTVALKIMKADRSGNPQAVSRFEREMKAIGRLEHPHIVRALDAGEQGGVYFLVMEYVAGIDLDQLIRSLGPLPVADACEIARQAALGLAHAHEHSLVHRDVKPSNLMLSPEGQVKVLDLGLAQFQQSAGGGLDLTVEGQMIGTLLYMSPEQLAGGKNVDHRSDVFSLGVTLYCLLAGGLPLERGQPAAMLPEIGKIRAEVPPEVRALLTKLLAPAPEDRIGSMSRVAELLKPLASGRPLTALLKTAQNRPTDRTALPPSLLPSRLPPIQSPAATVSTTRANQDATLITPVIRPAIGRRLAGNWSSAAWSSAGWSIAGVVAIALLAILAVVFWPEGSPPPLVPGTLVVVGANADQPQFAELMQNDAIHAIDAAGKVVRLRAGANELPPGMYQFVVAKHDLQLQVTTMTIAAGRSLRLEVSVPEIEPSTLPKPSLVASIPDMPGPLVSYTGKLWYAGLPTDQDTAFRLTVRALDNEAVRGVPHRWIEVEAITQTESGDYKETGLLLVDLERYQRERDLQVTQGWISAESELLKQRLNYQFPEASLEQLTVEYQPIDRLQELAEKLQLVLPSDPGSQSGVHGATPRAEELNQVLPPVRLRVQDALVLLFDAQIPNAPEPLRTARSLPETDGRPIVAEETLDGALCRVVRSASEEQLDDDHAIGYSIAASPNVLFGLMRLRVQNEKLRVTCNYRFSNDKETPSPPKIERFVGPARTLAELHVPEPDPIGHAMLPAGIGALASYTGKLERGGRPQIEFEAHVRMAGVESVDGKMLPVLEVVAITESQKDTPEHREEARLRIIADRYPKHPLQIHDGWLRTMDATLPFKSDGDLKDAEDDLIKLDKRLPEDRLSVHDVLALLFGAELKASAGIGRLRAHVQRTLQVNGQNRKFRPTEIPFRGKPSVTADLWIIAKREAQQLVYEICRSHEVPFDFCTVNFESPSAKFKIVTGLVEFEAADAPPLLGDPRSLASAADATRQRIAAIDKDPNVKVWRDAAGKLIEYAEFAEFAGTRLDAKLRVEGVWLQPKVGGKLIERKLAELSDYDRTWVAAGRHWETYNDRREYVHYYKSGEQAWVKLRLNDGQVMQIEFGRFTRADQAWILRQNSLRTQPVATKNGKR